MPYLTIPSHKVLSCLALVVEYDDDTWIGKKLEIQNCKKINFVKKGISHQFDMAINKI